MIQDKRNIFPFKTAYLPNRHQPQYGEKIKEQQLLQMETDVLQHWMTVRMQFR